MFFFILGVESKTKDIGRAANVVCPACGALTSLEITVLYQVFHIFFIPLIKWNRRYLARSYCCGAVFELDSEEGRAFERGEKDYIDPRYLRRAGGLGGEPGHGASSQACPHCGAQLAADALFCHRCGERV